jgi:predicted glycoside hydrolase/deacetylase ChbG (UPF0249 family)
MTVNGIRKVVVVNADDLGFSSDINSTIEEGYRKGCITNASLMVDGKEIEGALSVVRRNPGLGLGLHLDLCPVLGFYERPYWEMRESLRSREMQRKVEDEVDRQIRVFKSLGLEFTHLDGHRHFHALPEIFETVVDVAAGHGLRTIRFMKNWILPKTPSVYWDEQAYGAAKEMLDGCGILYPNHFIYGADEYSAESFGPGVNELMVHVAYHDEYFHREYLRVSRSDFWQAIREADMEIKSYIGLVGASEPVAT